MPEAHTEDAASYRGRHHSVIGEIVGSGNVTRYPVPSVLPPVLLAPGPAISESEHPAKQPDVADMNHGVADGPHTRVCGQGGVEARGDLARKSSIPDSPANTPGTVSCA